MSDKASPHESSVEGAYPSDGQDRDPGVDTGDCAECEAGSVQPNSHVGNLIGEYI